MGNIFGRETETSPPPRELPPILEATRQRLYYGRDLPYEDTFQNRGVPRIQHPRPCVFYARGACLWGTTCQFSHEGVVNTFSTQNSRKPCRFFMRGHCRRGEACNFSHEEPSVQESTEAIKDDDCAESWVRELGGAWVKFGDGAAIMDVSLPSDFSAIQIRNLPTSASANSVRALLSYVGIPVSTSDIRYTRPKDMPNGFATVKVKDPTFAKTACSRLQTCIEPPGLIVNSIHVPIPSGFQFGQVDNRQVRCSWHRPTRASSLYFSNKKFASRSFYKFKDGEYKINGIKATVQSPVAEHPGQQNGRWKIDLVGLSASITEDGIASAFPSFEKPCLITIGDLSYEMDIEMNSTLVKFMLYEKGELEKWNVSDSSTAKRIKAQATFMEECHAQVAASSLDGTELPFNHTGKLFVQLITSVKFKVSARVYDTVKKTIDSHKSNWNRQFIRYSALPERGSNRILKIEGEDRQLVAQAKRDLEKIITGTVLTMDGKNIWYSNLKISKNAYRKLQKIERDLEVVIIRDIRASNFRAFGPESRLAQAAEALQQLINELKAGDHAIKKVVSTVKRQQLETDCPICFDEAEESLETSCGHIYCSLCFFNMCQAEASTSGDFSIGCMGNSGTCGKIIQISELQTLILSKTFENILEASFASFIRRHPAEFRYCSTPDCDQVYRVSSPGKLPSTFTCARCFTPTCTACHDSHLGISCAKHKGNSSEDIEELIKAKEDLGAKDCPKCTTALQKAEGCNHMTCLACGTHICWVCMATFTEGSDCYRHMGQFHGSFV
ncbi:related to ariadne-2 protein [Fusarium proliferatum]|nr:related to ariadne-2 protein [Fusarium proliferatum]